MVDSFLTKCNNLNVVLFTTTVLLLDDIIEVVKISSFSNKNPRYMRGVFALLFC